jgi:hypothetical protein
MEISARAGLKFNQIGFKTYRGAHKTIGNENGDLVTYHFPGTTFGAVSGGYGEHLDYLDIRVHPLLAERLTSFVNK